MPTATYDRVKDILSAAAGDSPADYGGLGRFWELPLDRLLDAKLYTIPLIAPETRKSCCSHTPDPCATRSARSGLILGLRGAAPFDGGQYPRLPWGGTPVAEEDIQLIADWIDEGCSPTGRAETFDLLPAPAQLVAITAERPPAPAVEFSDAEVNDYLYQRGEPRQRMNLDCMTETQVEKFRYAMRELYELNKWPEDSRSYNGLALIHQNHCQHGWERFLPWHRVYLYEFEQALQDHCPDVTVPYWDWTMDQYKPHTPTDGDIIPNSFKAFLRPRSLAVLKTVGFTEAEAQSARASRQPAVHLYQYLPGRGRSKLLGHGKTQPPDRCPARCQLPLVPAPLPGRIPGRER
jgi:tyrosinase